MGGNQSNDRQKREKDPLKGSWIDLWRKNWGKKRRKKKKKKKKKKSFREKGESSVFNGDSCQVESEQGGDFLSFKKSSVTIYFDRLSIEPQKMLSIHSLQSLQRSLFTSLFDRALIEHTWVKQMPWLFLFGMLSKIGS